MSKATTKRSPRVAASVRPDGARRLKAVTHIKDLVPDPHNRRQHNPRNIGLLTDALQRVGAARSIVIDENDSVLAGNGVVEAAADAGITRVRVVEADGNELIAVRRRGLTPEQKRYLAIADNRTAELADWDVDQLLSDQAAGLDLSPFFYDEELAKILPKEGAEATVSEVDVSEVADQFWISIRGPLPHQAVVLQRLQSATADVPDVQVELGTVSHELEAWKP